MALYFTNRNESTKKSPYTKSCDEERFVCLCAWCVRACVHACVHAMLSWRAFPIGYTHMLSILQ